jgi:bacteriocin biosynthesis cyclodehydratase domain-containing protein
VELDRSAIWPEDAGELPDLFVVPQEAHDPHLLQAMDAFSKRRKTPWMLLRALDPHEGWIGPLFIPGETASYVSLEARYRGNHPFIEEYRACESFLLAAERPSARCGGLAAFADLLSAIAVSEIIKLVAEIAIPQIAGKFLTVNLSTWETELHEVLRVPRLEMESYSQPRVFPWKDIPYGDKQTRRA